MTKKHDKTSSVILTDFNYSYEQEYTGIKQHILTQTYTSYEEIDPSINYVEEYFRMKTIYAKTIPDKQETEEIIKNKNRKLLLVKNAIDSVEV